MKPFNLERALAGDPVVTRDGKTVTQLIRFKTEVKKQNILYGVIDGCVHNWTLDGRRESDIKESPFDLFMGFVKQGGWLNVYPSATNKLGRVAWQGSIYNSKELADRFDTARIACVYVEWEE
jgi:hypothetical protein